MRFSWLSLSVLVAMSGCASSRWSFVATRPLAAITVAPAEMHGPVDRVIVAQRRATLIGVLRARGYRVLDNPAPGVPTLTIRFEGKMIDDSQLHAPDDARHGIYNDLHYQFVAYRVQLDVVDGSGHPVASGSASSDQDPEGAVTELTALLVRDVPAASANLAIR